MRFPIILAILLALALPLFPASVNAEAAPARPTLNVAVVPTVEASSPEMLAAYRAALVQLLTEHTYPDGTESGWDESFDTPSDNSFALFDIDMDGAQELIICVTTAPMAGMLESVYRYDAETETLTAEFTEFPALTYYSNGLVKAEWSHNHGLAGERFWPYSLYFYDAVNDSFLRIASVDAWDRTFAEKDYDGNPFPDSIDVNDDGIVFLLAEGDAKQTLSKADYEQWAAELFGESAPIEIPYMALTAENIAALI